MHDFRTWYRALNGLERDEYARRAGVSRLYIEVHLLHRRKAPKRETMVRLADASLGRVAYEELVAFFYARPAGEKAA
jgi:hypothetical protein